MKIRIGVDFRVGADIMAYEALLDEAKGSPDYIIEQTLLFMRFLKANYKSTDRENSLERSFTVTEADKPAGTATSASSTTRKHPKRVLGAMKGKIIMADDFDEIPECFKDYV